METVTRAQFAKQPGRYQEEAMFGQPVIITNGRDRKPRTVLLSYEMFEQLVVQNRRVIQTMALGQDTLSDILNGEMDPRHNHLNDLMDKPLAE